MPTDHGVPGSNPSGAPFVHLEMGGAKECSPKNSKSDVHPEMGDAKERSLLGVSVSPLVALIIIETRIALIRVSYSIH